VADLETDAKGRPLAESSVIYVDYAAHRANIMRKSNTDGNGGVRDVDLSVDCQWRRQDLVPGRARAKVAGFLQEATVDSRCQTLYRSKCTEKN